MTVRKSWDCRKPRSRLLDPIGFGLENFDAIGRWRDQDEKGRAIDASGELPGGRNFSNPKELKTLIAEQKAKFSRNLVERLLAYALCRKLEGYDEIVVDELMKNDIFAFLRLFDFFTSSPNTPASANSTGSAAGTDAPGRTTENWPAFANPAHNGLKRQKSAVYD